MRTTSSDENIKLETPRQITLELALEFIQDDELIEVTPDAIRLRKRVLDPNMRKKAAKRAAQRSPPRGHIQPQCGSRAPRAEAVRPRPRTIASRSSA